MHPYSHFAIALVIGVVLYFFNLIDVLQAGIFIVAGVLIDIDHLPELFQSSFRELVKPKNFFNLKRFKEVAKGSRQNYLMLFHTIEFIILLFILSFKFPLLFFVASGFTVHALTDFLYVKFLLKYKGREFIGGEKSWFLTSFILRRSFKTDDSLGR